MRMERKVMMAAIRSRPECKASERTPRLPVLTTRKVFNETRSVAEPTLKSAARFFSRASWIGATISIAGSRLPQILYFSRNTNQMSRSRAEELFRCGHGRRRQNRKPLGLAPFATDFHFIEEQRRCDDRSRQTNLRRAKRAECFFYGSGDLRYLHSFPTRRSSDSRDVP